MRRLFQVQTDLENHKVNNIASEFFGRVVSSKKTNKVKVIELEFNSVCNARNCIAILEAYSKEKTRRI